MKHGDDDERYYTCRSYIDRHGKYHRGKVFRANFEERDGQWGYIKGTLREFKWKAHDGHLMEDDENCEPSLADLFKDK